MLLAAAGGEGPVMVLGAFVIVGFVVLSTLASSKREAEDRLRGVSQRLGADFRTGGLFELPSLSLRVGRYFGTLNFAEGRNEHTSLLLGVPDYRGGSLEIRPPGFLPSQGIPIGDRRFDEDFVVEAYPRELAYWIFADPRRCEAIATVRRLAGYGSVSITMRAGWLEVRVGNCLKDEASLRALVRSASEMTGYMLTPPGETGIRWVEVRPLTGTCPVCSTALAAPVLRCDRCDTPHHEQCWDYLGRCAVYGCEPQPRRRAA